MEKFIKIFWIVWVCLALISFVSAFWAPLFYKIIGIAFGSINIIAILSVVISYFQGAFNKEADIEDGMPMQTEDEETYKEETSAE